MGRGRRRGEERKGGAGGLCAGARNFRTRAWDMGSPLESRTNWTSASSASELSRHNKSFSSIPKKFAPSSSPLSSPPARRVHSRSSWPGLQIMAPRGGVLAELQHGRCRCEGLSAAALSSRCLGARRELDLPRARCATKRATCGYGRNPRRPSRPYSTSGRISCKSSEADCDGEKMTSGGLKTVVLCALLAGSAEALLLRRGAWCSGKARAGSALRARGLLAAERCRKWARRRRSRSPSSNST